MASTSPGAGNWQRGHGNTPRGSEIFTTPPGRFALWMLSYLPPGVWKIPDPHPLLLQGTIDVKKYEKFSGFNLLRPRV